MLNKTKNVLASKISGVLNAHLASTVAELTRVVEKSMVLQAEIESKRRKLCGFNPNSIQDAEFRVFSQFGDDGIIDFLAEHIPTERWSFIEFGVEDYTEANTRLLLELRNWSGLIIDSSRECMQRVRSRDNIWKYNLSIVDDFVTRENINSTFKSSGFTGEVGILSIDIDGNDYWIWEAIDVVHPYVVICEYNSLFGSKASVTVPYDPAFDRLEKHFTNLYYGASLPALVRLASQKGMRFLGCNSAGNNAYFVNASLQVNLESPTVQSGFVEAKFREGRDQDKNLCRREAKEQIELIANLPLVDVNTGQTILVGDLL